MALAADRERARHALSFHAKPLGLGRPPVLSQAGGRKHPLQHFAGPSKQNSSLVNASMQRLRMGHITLQLTSSTVPTDGRLAQFRCPPHPRVSCFIKSIVVFHPQNPPLLQTPPVLQTHRPLFSFLPARVTRQAGEGERPGPIRF